MPIEWQRHDHIHVPGYFFLDEPEYQPGDALHKFLAEGQEPVCLTFGSMVNRQIERIQEIFVNALKNTRQRGIILSGWGKWGIPEGANEDLLFLESAPHEWLFPRCKLVIHHGGAGTTAAALRSGRPSVIVPMAGDQPFWARCVDQMGVGPHSIALKSLSLEKLEQVILAADEAGFCEKAWKTGSGIRAEDGCGAAVQIIEAHTALFGERSGSGKP